LTTENRQAQARPAVSPLLALIFSTAVLPGLGQFLTGRPIRGLAMAGATALWIPVALIKTGLDLNQVLPALLAQVADGRALTFGEVQAALSPLAGGLTWVFLPLVAIWLWTVADALVYLKNSNSKGL
jgi:TM2 domain-containing membrane protein YozV